MTGGAFVHALGLAVLPVSRPIGEGGARVDGLRTAPAARGWLWSSATPLVPAELPATATGGNAGGATPAKQRGQSTTKFRASAPRTALSGTTRSKVTRRPPFFTASANRYTSVIWLDPRM